MRIIMHIDMNSYFASCEQQDNFLWRGKPLGVCEHLGGIIIAPSVEAKEWGVKTAMPVWEARKLCPQIILTKTNPDRYRFYTARFLRVLNDYTSHVEKYSIDEAFLDVTDVTNIFQPNKDGVLTVVDPFVEAEKIGKEIQRRVKEEVGDYLRCSVGIAWNKLVAKIASDMKKPNGLVVLRQSDKDWLYEKLKLTDVPGIGNRMVNRLFSLGIRTLVDLKNFSKEQLVAMFGIPGYHLASMGRLEGSYKEGFSEDEEVKSIGHMYTIPKDQRSSFILMTVLYQLSEMVAIRLRKQGFSATVIAAFVRDDKYESFGGSQKLGENISDGKKLFDVARYILKKQKISDNFVPKLVGVTASGLVKSAQQSSLFLSDRKIEGLNSALDDINDKYGPYTVGRAVPMAAKSVIRDSVGFGRMKEFKVNPASYGRGKRI
jgi:DNA polymerase-4